MLVSLSVIFILLILSAFFSGSETALTAASRPLMHEMERNGNRRAALINHLSENRERLIGAILLGNNLVNIMASAMATGLLITVFGEAGVLYATVAMTFLILIFAEIFPKTYAIRNADRTALAIAPIINVVVVVLAPVTLGIHYIIRAVFKVFGFARQGETSLTSTAEELRGAIDLHNEAGGTAKHERAMLRSILDLAEVQIGEIMIHRKSVAMIDVTLSAEEVTRQVLASPYTRIPLWRGEPENIVGVLHAKALLRAVRAQGGKKGAGPDVLTLAAKPWFIPESTSLLDQLHAFRARHEHFALVIDEYGSFQGIVTLEDILEEIVGEISDEHDIAASGVRPQPDGSYQVRGDITIRDLNRQFEWSLPDEEAATLAGLILHESRRIPEAGQVFLFHGFRFEILRRHKHQITLIGLTPPKDGA